MSDLMPRLRHSTFVFNEDGNAINMIVGRDIYEIESLCGSKNQFLGLKRYFDGRHSIDEMSAATGLTRRNIEQIVQQFSELGLLRAEKSTELILTEDFLRRIDDTCLMWSRQIGYHRIFGLLQSGAVRKEVFLGWLLETYHYVKSSSYHIATALSNCQEESWRHLLEEYLIDEAGHHKLIFESLLMCGFSADSIADAHPLIGTQSLISMLCDIGRVSPLAYLSCTCLIEARPENFDLGKASLEDMSRKFGYSETVVAPIIEHMRGDILAGHQSLLSQALSGHSSIGASQAHVAVNSLHDLKHSFDQFHDQILSYYSDIANYIPRLKVDYFSL